MISVIPRELLEAAVIVAERRRRRSQGKLIREGQKRAKERGVHIGRPVVQFDPTHAISLRAAGYSLRAIARATGLSASTVLRAITRQRGNV